MKFLVDQPVSPLLARWLRDNGHDAVHVRERALSSATDPSLVMLAIAEQRLLITADLDFPRLVALSQQDRPAVILFRAGNITDREMLGLLQRVLDEVEPSRLGSSIVVVDEHSIRIAALPITGRGGKS